MQLEIRLVKVSWKPHHTIAREATKAPVRGWKKNGPGPQLEVRGNRSHEGAL